MKDVTLESSFHLPISGFLVQQHQLYEHIEKMLEPQRRLQTQVDKLVEPYRRMQGQMEKMLEPQRRLQAQVDKLVEPYRRMQGQMDKILEPQRRLQGQVDQLLEPYRRMQEQLGKMFEPQRRLQVQMDKLLAPQVRLHDEIFRASEASLRWQGIFERYLSGVASQSIEVTESGFLRIGVEEFGNSSFDDEMSKISSIAESASTPEEFAEGVEASLCKTKSLMLKFVVYILLPYFFSVLANLTTPTWERLALHILSPDTPSEPDTPITTLSMLADLKEMSNLRVLRGKRIKVMQESCNRSAVVDELTGGQVVRFIRKSNKWVEIEYLSGTSDFEGEGLSIGWVKSKYVRPFCFR